MTKLHLSWSDVEMRVDALLFSKDVQRTRKRSVRPLFIHGVPRGGLIPAAMLAARVGGCVTNDPRDADIIIDDIIDSGATQCRFRETFPKTPFLALVNKKNCLHDWVVFPWELEEQQGPERNITRLLQFIGEDPNREGLKDTPARVLKAWKEMASGYEQDPAKILARDFDAGSYDEMIVCPWVEFYSTCEHHLLPFSGSVHIAYLPNKRKPRVVGLSKMARLVDCYGRRLQIQERMTMEIADAMQKHLQPSGVAVVVQAKHLCMACRGVKKHKASMVTSAMRGAFRSDAKVRSEFFQLVELGSKQT